MTITLGRNFIFRKFRFSRFWVIRSSKILLDDMFSILDQSYFIIFHIYTFPAWNINHQPSTINHDSNSQWIFTFGLFFKPLTSKNLAWGFRPLFFGLDHCYAAHSCLKKRRRENSFHCWVWKCMLLQTTETNL